MKRKGEADRAVKSVMAGGDDEEVMMETGSGIVDEMADEEEGAVSEVVPDPHYNLVSVLYHTLQAAETGELYVEDAEEAGDDELASFFRNVVEEDKQRAARAKELLASRLSQSTESMPKRRAA